MTLMDRYLFTALVRGGAPVLLLLLGLFGFINLTEQLEDTGRGRFGAADALLVTGLTLPSIALDLLPVICLVGAVWGLGGLGSRLELTALRASGAGVWRIARPLLALLALIVLIAASAQQWLIPILEREASMHRATRFMSTVREGDAYWTRTEASLVRVGSVAYGTMPMDIEIYQLDDLGRVSQLIQSERADLAPDGAWLLQQVVLFQFDEAAVTRQDLPRMRWQGEMDPARIAALLQADHALAPSDLIGTIRQLEANDLDAHRYEMLLWQRLSLPIGLFGMGLLGLPFVLASSRARPQSAQVVVCLIVGLGCYLAEQGAAQIGLLYRLPAALMTLSVDLTVLASALALIRLRR